ncbi:MAG: T9SS type A sorting domain-containing protein, partial [Bacteroidales bacterium]|nr:T9SS type A sorting domain-containing protein [Bacteroidales bacterium]
MKNFHKILFTGFLLCIFALPVLSFGGSDFTDGQTPVSLEIFPNPVTGNTFTISASSEIFEVSIVNILGQQVFEQKYTGETKINIELEIKEKG